MATHKRMAKRGLLTLGVTVGVLAVTTIGVRAAVAEVYRVPMTSMEPEIPAGSRVLVYKLADTFAPGEIIAYRHSSNQAWLGRVDAVDQAAGTLTIHRNGTGPVEVALADVIGRVVLSTR